MNRVSDEPYMRSAAEGMVKSMAHYGNTSPATGDGRVSTPAWFANRLGKVMYARGESVLPGTDKDWWGKRWLAYAEQILAEIDTPVHQRPSSCHVCGSAEDHGPTFDRTGKGHNFWSNADAAAEARRHDANVTYSQERAYVEQHRPY